MPADVMISSLAFKTTDLIHPGEIEIMDMTSDMTLSRQYANEDAFGMVPTEANPHLG